MRNWFPRSFVIQVLAGVTVALITAIFIEPVLNLIIGISPTALARQIEAQRNEVPEGATRLKAREVLRPLKGDVSVEAKTVQEYGGIPKAWIVIRSPNRTPVEEIVGVGQEAIFTFRNAKYALKVVQLMPEDETADVEIYALDE